MISLRVTPSSLSGTRAFNIPGVAYSGRMDYLYTILKFVVGGSIIVGVTLLAQGVDPKYGGILAAAPITTTLAFLFTYSESGAATTQQLVLGAFYFAVPTLVFLCMLYLLMNRFPFVQSLAGAYAVWLGALVITYRIVTPA